MRGMSSRRAAKIRSLDAQPEAMIELGDEGSAVGSSLR